MCLPGILFVVSSSMIFVLLPSVFTLLHMSHYLWMWNNKHFSIWHWRKPWCQDNTESSAWCLMSFPKAVRKILRHMVKAASLGDHFLKLSSCGPKAIFLNSWYYTHILIYNGYRQVYKFSSRSQKPCDLNKPPRRLDSSHFLKVTFQEGHFHSWMTEH